MNMQLYRKQLELLFLVLVSLSSSSILHSQNISTRVATKVAENHLNQVATSRLIEQTFTIDTIVKNYYNGKLCYYTIVFSGKGYVNVAATDASIPILSYSLERYKPHDRNASPACKEWMEGYCKELDFIMTNELDNSETQYIWDKYLDNDFKGKDITVGPLLTSIWGQSVEFTWECPGYNFYIPGQSGCNCERCAAGCVAIAMAQVMYFWSYPINAGYYSYYDWCNMSDELDNTNTFELNAIAKLIYDCAESVDMGYCADGCSSSASTQDAVDALRFQFGYHEDIDYKRKWWHSLENWKGFIKSDINNGQPIIYRGEGSNGHAFVCDGYEEIGGNDSFHFNWGWYGNENDFYTLDNLNPGSSNYSDAQAAIFHIKPNPSYYHNYCDIEINLFNYYLSYYSSGGSSNPWEIVPKTMQRLFSCDETAPADWRTIPSGESSEYFAHEKIVLYPGFKAELGSEFVAQITPCPNCDSKNIRNNTEHTDSKQKLVSAEIGYQIEMNQELNYSEPKEIKIYPNPNTGLFFVKLNTTTNLAVSLEIVNLMGISVYQQDNVQSSVVSIDMSSISSGLYLVKIFSETDELLFTEKLVIE